MCCRQRFHRNRLWQSVSIEALAAPGQDIFHFACTCSIVATFFWLPSCYKKVSSTKASKPGAQGEIQGNVVLWCTGSERCCGDINLTHPLRIRVYRECVYVKCISWKELTQINIFNKKTPHSTLWKEASSIHIWRKMYLEMGRGGGLPHGGSKFSERFVLFQIIWWRNLLQNLPWLAMRGNTYR